MSKEEKQERSKEQREETHLLTLELTPKGVDIAKGMSNRNTLFISDNLRKEIKDVYFQ